MQITINNIKQTEDDQNVYFTLTDDNGNDYEWHGDVPLGQDVTAHFNNRIDEIWKLILGKRFPDIREVNTSTTLSGIEQLATASGVEQWVTDNNPKENPWKSTHPKTLNIKTRIDAAKDLADLKTILKDMIK